ncbi:MAG TPA: Gfo/Idh/MocA family oxidoreductase, partial [Bacteroidales bacterium]|nr:Gfo/Idh/MocA family oxidoreductase [Bacteroidales bacterium]
MKRRTFITNSVTAAAGTFIIPTIVPSSVIGKNPPSDRINIGWIGCGRQGRGDVIQVMGFDTAMVTAVSDVDSNRMMLGKQFIDGFYTKKTGNDTFSNAKTFADYKDMLLDRSIDAVLITTPDHWHSQPGIEAALAGKDIYLEKPTSLTIAEGRLLSDIVRRRNIILQVGTQQRSSFQWRLAAELVRNGRIGKLHTVKIGLPGDPAGPEAPEMPIPKNLNYDMWLGPAFEAPYTMRRVHEPGTVNSRPGWFRIHDYCNGMITN